VQQKKSKLEDLEGHEEHLPAVCHARSIARSSRKDGSICEIATYQTRRKTEGAAARTLNKELQVLRQVLKRYKFWAVLQGEVKFEREHASVGKALTPEDESMLLGARSDYKIGRIFRS
jgi:hypothetical protein